MGLSFYLKDASADKGKCLRRAKRANTLPLLGRLIAAETQAEAEKLLETFSIEKLQGSQNRANPRNFQGVGSGAC